MPEFWTDWHNQYGIFQRRRFSRGTQGAPDVRQLYSQVRFCLANQVWKVPFFYSNSSLAVNRLNLYIDSPLLIFRGISLTKITTVDSQAYLGTAARAVHPEPNAIVTVPNAIGGDPLIGVLPSLCGNRNN